MAAARPSPEEPRRSAPRPGDAVRQPKVPEKAAADLRLILAQSRGRRPQEVLGTIAGTHLTRSIALAAVATLLVLAIGTIVPWLTRPTASQAKPSASAANVPVKPATPIADTVANKANATPSVPSSTGPAPPATPSPADAQKAAKAMGIGETKAADPMTNPRERSLDNLLDKLD